MQAFGAGFLQILYFSIIPEKKNTEKVYLYIMSKWNTEMLTVEMVVSRKNLPEHSTYQSQIQLWLAMAWT